MTLGSQVFTNAARYGGAGMRLTTFGYHSITRGYHLGLRHACAAEASRVVRRRI
jgi:hypothetical protein